MSILKASLVSTLVSVIAIVAAWSQVPSEMEATDQQLATINMTRNMLGKESEEMQLGCTSLDKADKSCYFILYPQMFPWGYDELEAKVVGRLPNGKIVRLYLTHGQPGEDIKVPSGYQLVSCYCDQKECFAGVNTPTNKWYFQKGKLSEIKIGISSK